MIFQFILLLFLRLLLFRLGKIFVYGAWWARNGQFNYNTQGDDNWIWFVQLSTVHDQMEPCHRNNAQSVQRNRQRSMYDGKWISVDFDRHNLLINDSQHCLGLLWATCSPSRRMDAENPEISRCSMERLRVASRGIYQQTEWCIAVKVSWWSTYSTKALYIILTVTYIISPHTESNDLLIKW